MIGTEADPCRGMGQKSTCDIIDGLRKGDDCPQAPHGTPRRFDLSKQASLLGEFRHFRHLLRLVHRIASLSKGVATGAALHFGAGLMSGRRHPA